MFTFQPHLCGVKRLMGFGMSVCASGAPPPFALHGTAPRKVVQPEPGEALGVFCIDAYSDTLTEKLVQFVKHGGGLLIGGQACNWASQQGSDKVLFSFPGNQVTSVAGVYH